MKIKRYEAKTEQEAIEKVKQDLGLEALILNIKKTQPRGIFSFFRKASVEVTAAYEDKNINSVMEELPKEPSPAKEEHTVLVEEPNNLSSLEEEPLIVNSEGIKEQDKIEKEFFVQQIATIKNLEKRLTDTEGLLEKAVEQLSVTRLNQPDHIRQYENNLVQIFFDALIEQGVYKEIAKIILEDIHDMGNDDELDLNMIVKVVYGKIINILGEPQALHIQTKNANKPKIIVFIGPTGVGKTTVIAKLSSIMILEKKLRVGLITADTYRIAAVEQLRTYADILGIDIGVVYNPNDLVKYVKGLNKSKDIIMIDTAGRSHKNKANLDELNELLATIPKSDRFLVLSTTTKCEDLIQIVETYSGITDFNLIFTKLDETTCLGSILNICYLTGKKISYVTHGQNVPDDIEVIKPEKIARALMGLEA